MNARKYLVLLGVILFSSFGDVFLSKGMKQVGEISAHNVVQLLSALLNPWVLGGIALLILFFISWMTALSWADLTYVLPASAIGYVIMALLARFFLHEQVSFLRWFGIVLIVAGVGFVAGGPVATVHEDIPESVLEPEEVQL